jgi:hypothetical protein
MTYDELNALINTLPAAYLPVVEAYIHADWKTYERLDPDRAILRAAYELAPREVRRLLGSSGRQGGRTEIVEILATSQVTPLKPHIPTTPSEADVLFETLKAQRRYTDLWALAQIAPPLLSARILVWLADNNWQPDTAEDRAVFPHLVKLASLCAHLSPQYGLMYKKRRISFYRALSMQSFLRLIPEANLIVVVETGSLTIFNLDKTKLRTVTGTFTSYEEVYYLDDIYISHAYDYLLWHDHNRFKREYHIIDLKTLETLQVITHSLGCSYFIDRDQILSTQTFTREPFSKGKEGLFLILKDVQTNKSLLEFDGPIPSFGVKAAVSPNKKIVVVCFNWSLWFWSVETGQKLLEVVSDMHLNLDGTFTFSPDSRQVVISGYAGRVHFLDLKSGKLVRQIDTPNTGTRSLAFSSDGKFLAVGSNDQNIAVYNLETGQLVQNMLRHGKRVDQVALRDDGLVVSASENGLACIWASRLTELCERPLEQNEMRILRWIAKQLQRHDLTTAERSWLEFAQAMLHLRWRYAVEIETDIAYKTTAAPTDIEL